MSQNSITYKFLEANPEAALAISTGYDEMFAQLVDGRHYYQFFGHGETVVQALQNLDADIEASGVSIASFAFPGHTQQALDAAREDAIAKMRQQIEEEEAAAMDEARENAKQEAFLRLTEEVGLTDMTARRVIATVERQARMMV